MAVFLLTSTFWSCMSGTTLLTLVTKLYISGNKNVLLYNPCGTQNFDQVLQVLCDEFQTFQTHAMQNWHLILLRMCIFCSRIVIGFFDAPASSTTSKRLPWADITQTSPQTSLVGPSLAHYLFKTTIKSHFCRKLFFLDKFLSRNSQDRETGKRRELWTLSLPELICRRLGFFAVNL